MMTSVPPTAAALQGTRGAVNIPVETQGVEVLEVNQVYAHLIMEDTMGGVTEDTMEEAMEDTTEEVTEDTMEEVMEDTMEEVTEDTMEDLLEPAILEV